MNVKILSVNHAGRVIMTYVRFNNQQIMQCRNNAELMEELLKNTQRLVYKIARKYHIKGYDLDDLLLLGQLEVYKAVHSFEVGRETDFYTYAFTYIVNRYRRLVKDSKAKKRGGLGQNATAEDIEKREDAKIKPSKLEIVNLKSDHDVFYDATKYDKWEFLLNDKVLTQNEYEVIIEIYAKNRLLKEIAQDKGVKYQAIGNTHTRALNKIRSKYTSEQVSTLLLGK